MASSGLFPDETLRALLNRLIPRDEFPGAIEAGVEDYLRGSLAGRDPHELNWLAEGLRHLDRESATRHRSAPFADLAPAEQDGLLREIEAGKTVHAWPTECPAAAFFARMVDLAHEGFYADPANGGNRDGISWRMIGYRRGIPVDLDSGKGAKPA